MAEKNRTLIALVAIIAVVLIASLFFWSGMMGSWGGTNMGGGGMMGGWGSNANPGRSALTMGFWALIVVAIGGIIIWAIRKPGAPS